MSRLSMRRKRPREEEKIPELGKCFDVVSLLSSYGGSDLIRNNGDRVALSCDTFKGKHVLLCCFQVPVDVSCILKFHWLVTLCNELCSTRKEKDDFEMVVVASMEDDDKEAFDHLLSWFPKSCLAVPFDNWKTHDYMCKVLGLGAGGPYSFEYPFEYVFLNAMGYVSPFPSFDEYNQDTLDLYGADAFPFTEDVIKEMDEECRRVMFEESNNLEAVLRCNGSAPAYVYKFGGGPGERLHISKLSNKHVGLFLCSGGDLIYDLVEKYEQCRKNKLDFEVVVVYSPRNSEMNRMGPQKFKKHVDELLRMHINTCHRWWFLPFNYSLSKRLWRMTRHHNTYSFWQFKLEFVVEEAGKLIVVGPGVKHLDMYGAEVLKCEGISGYPFTTEAAIAYKLKKLRDFSLESLFAGSGVTRGDDRQRRVVPVGELKARKVFLFFLQVDHDFDFETILPVYTELKKRYGYEMVVVEMGAHLVPDIEVGPSGEILFTCPITGRHMFTNPVSDEERREIESKMPWYVCPVNKSLMELLRAVCMSEWVLVGFGDDGRLCNLFDASQGFELRLFKPRKTSLYHQVEKFLGYDHLTRRMRD